MKREIPSKLEGFGRAYQSVNVSSAIAKNVKFQVSTVNKQHKQAIGSILKNSKEKALVARVRSSVK